MARKSPKCPPTVDPNQFGCVWNFSGMFDHHHHPRRRPNRKLPSNDSHGGKALPGAGEVRMVNFDEQLRMINIESKKKTAVMKRSVQGETSSSNQTRKNNKTVEISFWKKIKSRYENPNKKTKNPSFVDRIVVLKPVQNVVDVGCRFTYLHTNSPVSDVSKTLKNVKKPKNGLKTRSFEGSDGLKREKLSLVSLSNQREPEVFVEAKRHLAERLRQVEKGVGSSSKQGSRTLERILLSSPVNGSMASFYPLKQDDGSSASGSLEITDTNDFLQGDSKFPNKIGPTGSRSEFSLDVSSPKSDCVSKSEAIETDQFRENPSPVSVLESFFSDNISSPTSTIESVELHIQPTRLDFEDHSSQTSSPPHRKPSLNTLIEDRVFISSYINTIYESSRSNWDEFVSTDYPLESSCDHKLLHDCVKEVLASLDPPWIAFFGSKTRRFSIEKDVVDEVMERAHWHNGQPAGPRTLDQLVGRDIAKSGKWVDVNTDGNEIVFEVVDETLEELILEAVFEILV